MTNNKQQTEINAVEYLGKVNQFAKENNTDKPRQQTAIEWLEQEMLKPNLSMKEILEQAKEMEKEQRSIEVPSDEEIEKESFDLYANHNTYSLNVRQYKAFKRGAKWMRDKIQGDDKQ